MARPNPVKSAVQTFRALNPKHGFAARMRPRGQKEEPPKSPPTGELYLYDAIGSDWYGGISAQMVADAVRSMEKDGMREMNIFINSPGGDVFEGSAIYSVLSRFSGGRHVYVDGLAASAASYIAMVGDDITTAFNAMWMVHNPWGIVIGDKNLMRETADQLEKVGGVMADTYVRRTKQDLADILAMMDAETWMTAQEARDRGFTDSVTEAGDGEGEDEAVGADGEPLACSACGEACSEHTTKDCEGCRPSADDTSMCLDCDQACSEHTTEDCKGCSPEKASGKKQDPTAPAPESSAAVAVLARYRKVPERLRPAASALIRTMEQRIMNLPVRASPQGATPGQPGRK